MIPENEEEIGGWAEDWSDVLGRLRDAIVLNEGALLAASEVQTLIYGILALSMVQEEGA